MTVFVLLSLTELNFYILPLYSLNLIVWPSIWRYLKMSQGLPLSVSLWNFIYSLWSISNSIERSPFFAKRRYFWVDRVSFILKKMPSMLALPRNSVWGYFTLLSVTVWTLDLNFKEFAWLVSIFGSISLYDSFISRFFFFFLLHLWRGCWVISFKPWKWPIIFS